MKRPLSRQVLLLGFVLVTAPTANAAVHNYSTVLNGPNEFPANPSLGTGFATVVYDDIAHTLGLNVSFSGLTGTTTASHIHAPTSAPFFENAGVATTLPSFAGFPLGVTSGTFSSLLDLTQASSWNPSYVTANGGIGGAEAAFFTAIKERKAYWNIHTNTSPGGEIRGFLIPEPSTCALMAMGASLIAFVRRRRE